jgi:hypothetical protein
MSYRLASMKNLKLRSVVIAGLATLLAACSGPESPQEVAQAFWQATIEGDSRDAARYSTLATAEDYERLAEDWPEGSPSWGRVVIDGDRASVVTEFTVAAQPGQRNRSFTTHLVHRDDAWLVDYERTSSSLHGGVFGELISAFGEFGKEFSRELGRSTEEANEQLGQMLGEMERAQTELGRQASDALEAYAEELRRALEELEESIDRALEEEGESPADEDPQLLHSASLDL